MPCSTPTKRRAWSRLAITALSVISKHTWAGATPVLSRHSTTNSRNWASPERLAGDVDGDAAVARHRDGAATQGGERGLHDPAVDQSHEPVALRGAHEFGRRQLVAGLVLQPHQHLHRRAAVLAVCRHDRLVIEVEAVFLERRSAAAAATGSRRCGAPAPRRAPSTPPRGPSPASWRRSRRSRPPPAAPPACRSRARSPRGRPRRRC